MNVKATFHTHLPADSMAGLSGPRAVFRRLDWCSRTLAQYARRAAAGAAAQPGESRWVEDSYSFMQHQICQTRRDLPAARIRKLLKAGTGAESNESRIYRLAAEYVDCDGPVAVDLAALTAFVRRHGPLASCELWAFSAMLRLALIERLCHSVDSESVASGCVRSLRRLERVCWPDLVESTSAVEEVLRRDPAGIYDAMDFDTKDIYRQEVEKLALRSGLADTQVAEAALGSAQKASLQHGIEHPMAHVGYYLMDAGAKAFGQFIGCKPTIRSAVASARRRYPSLVYGSTFLIVAALIVAAFDHFTGPLSYWVLALLLIPASQAALEIVNSIVCQWLPPRTLPGMDFSAGIPDSCQTMVAVPALLLSPGTVAKLIGDLEVRYLANRDRNLVFALLTDFPDADQQATDADSVLDVCISGIRKLNSQYGVREQGPFFLFHRPRRWNSYEGKWMGHERKRGKLCDLNRFLLGSGNAFDVVVGDRPRLREIRYVITLDADTQLPRDTASKLVACVAHPLNRPVVDPSTGAVIQGYGLIRPRVAVTMESAGRTLFSQIFSGISGFDPYVSSVSDVYQDFFGLTSFTGKGIYDLRAFDAAVGERFPDNAILSHDLIEGEHARTGFQSNVELVEDYPASYHAYSKRKHRWARGDWQLLPWLLPFVPSSSGHMTRNPLGLLSRWKLFDNLRRSLVEISFVLLLACGWVSSNRPVQWTLLVVALALLPAYADLVLRMLRDVRSFFSPKEVARQLLQRHRDVLLNLAFLPHQACLMADAILRTLFRLVSHFKLLEWETMAQSEAANHRRADIFGVYLYFSGASSLLFLFGSVGLNPVVRSILLLWAMAPLFAAWLSEPRPRGEALSSPDHDFLRQTALRTWRFFADNINAEHHWLVPDNVQEDPPRSAHRISPTNLGMSLTAHLAAYDFGYQTLDELSIALRRVFDSMGKMPRYRGHFYNWMDTASLQPVGEPYVSSVDSGNLAASLCVLRQGVLSAQKQPIFGHHILAGLRDHVLTLQDLIPSGLRSASLMRAIAALLRHLDCRPTDLFFWEETLTEARSLAGRIRDSLRRTHARPDGARQGCHSEEMEYWHGLLDQRLSASLEQLYALAPWLAPEFEPELRVNIRDEKLAALMEGLSRVPVLTELPEQYEYIQQCLLERLTGSEPLYPALRETLSQLLRRLPEAKAFALGLIHRCEGTCTDAFAYFEEIDFAFLFHEQRKALRIGYNVQAERLDEACYDLLASEARTAVFLAIAKDQIPREAWFRLGRKLIAYRKKSALVSWSGTMFEYLMPALYFRRHPDSLLDRAISGAVSIQRAYAREHCLPWGVSEAAYSARDGEMQYQYQAFGVPPLSANPSRSDTAVVAPYASMLALMVEPTEATANLRWLASLGCLGRYGFYESLDYSASLHGAPELIRSFMAHHQGMGLMAINNAVFGGRMQQRFHLDPAVQATEYLLEERLRPVDIVSEHHELLVAKRDGFFSTALRASRLVFGGNGRLSTGRGAEPSESHAA